MNRRLCLVLPVLFAACLLVCPIPGQGAAEPKAMPFNDTSIFNYFKNVEEKEGDLDRVMSQEEFVSRRCALYAKVMGEAGYDFEATVKAAAVPSVRMGDMSRNPRFKFLAGVFQIHPKEFLARKIISDETYQAVMAVFEEK